MSLLVWLPLDSNLNNLGLNPIVPTQVGSNLTISSGKIGYAYEWTSDG